MDDRELMRLHVEALYTTDGRGRLLRVREPNGADAPRFFIGRTARGSECRLRHDVDDDLARALAAACAAEPAGAEFLAPPHNAAPYEALLARAAPIERREAGPAYHVPTELPLPSAAGVVAVTAANADVLRPHLASWLGDVALGLPMYALLVEGRAVSICASVRTTPAADEAGVDTAPAFRGRGYAPLVVAAWAAELRNLGRVPLYSTSWQNAASQAVARTLGLRRFGADLHFT